MGFPGIPLQTSDYNNPFEMKLMKTISTTLILMLAITLGAQAAGEGVKSAKEIKKEAPRMIDRLNVSEFTNAELRIVEQRTLDATPDELWAFLGDSRKLPLFVKQVEKVTVNDQNADVNGQGGQRVCNFGGTALTEDIVYVVPERLFAYSAHDNELVSNHLGVIQLDQVGGQTVVTWYQYFDKGSKGFKSAMMKKMMPGILNKAMKNLEKEVQKS